MMLPVADCEAILVRLGWTPVPYEAWGVGLVRCYDNPRGGVYTLQEALDRAAPGTVVDPIEW